MEDARYTPSKHGGSISLGTEYWNEQGKVVTFPRPFGWLQKNITFD